MMLKKPRHEVLNLIRANAQATVYSSLVNNLGYAMKIDHNSVANAMAQAIADAVESGFQTLLENQYTDADFERDLTLKP